MKTHISVNLAFLLAVIFLTADLHADWSNDWKQTVAAAKKEGRLNLYVGRYGQAALLDEFKKDYPEIQIISVNGIPKEMLPGESRLVEGRKYLDVARHEFTDMTPVLKLAKEIVRAQEQK